MFEYLGNGLADEFLIPRELRGLDGLRIRIKDLAGKEICYGSETFTVDGEKIILKEPVPNGFMLKIENASGNGKGEGDISSLFSIAEDARRVNDETVKLAESIKGSLERERAEISELEARARKSIAEEVIAVKTETRNLINEIRAERGGAAKCEAKKIEQLLKGYSTDVANLLDKARAERIKAESSATRCADSLITCEEDYTKKLALLICDTKKRFELVVREAVGTMDVKFAERLGRLERIEADNAKILDDIGVVRPKVDEFIRRADYVERVVINSENHAAQMKKDANVALDAAKKSLDQTMTVRDEIARASEHAKGLMSCMTCGVKDNAMNIAEEAFRKFVLEADGISETLRKEFKSVEKKIAELEDIEGRIRKNMRPEVRK